jgi:glycosyltransferase involved in cell wall biosynthesis
MRVTVIVPTYNAAAWVAETIDSVIAQTYPHVEFIVVDDGSQDDSVAIVRAKLARDFKHDWQVVELGHNRGVSAARNAGLRAASGSWIQFLDSDDLIAPEKLACEMARARQAGPDVAAVYSPFRQCYIDAGAISWQGPLVDPDSEGRPAIMCLVNGFRPLHGAGLARREILDRIGGFDETLRFWECEEINVRLAKAGRFVRVPSAQPLYLWRLHRSQTYIGGASARYHSVPVALGWIAQVLRAADGKTVDRLGLAPAEKKALLDDCTFWGRLVYGYDRPAFRSYMAMVRRLDPHFVPTGPAYVSLAARYAGNEAAEGIGKLLRTPKLRLRRTLQRLRVWRADELYDWS